MATRNWTVSNVETYGDNARVVRWDGLLQSSADVGQPFEMPGSSDRSAQLLGTLGTGGAVTIEGSNFRVPGVNDWATLTDPQGNALVLNTLRVEAVMELTRWIRPRVSAGDGATNLSIALLMRRQ